MNRNSKTKEKFREYANAIEPHVRNIMEEIKKSLGGKIEISLKDVKTLLGPEFGKKYDQEIYWALKFVLLRHYDIIVDEKNRDVLTMRMATIDDWTGLLEHGAKYE